jgi:hypothetical protein
MEVLEIEVGTFRLELDRAHGTRAAFGRLLPFENQVIHSPWSGEAAWIPLGDFETGLPPLNATRHPSRGDLLFYPGGFSETEILFA